MSWKSLLQLLALLLTITIVYHQIAVEPLEKTIAAQEIQIDTKANKSDVAALTCRIDELITTSTKIQVDVAVIKTIIEAQNE